MKIIKSEAGAWAQPPMHDAQSNVKSEAIPVNIINNQAIISPQAQHSQVMPPQLDQDLLASDCDDKNFKLNVKSQYEDADDLECESNQSQ